MGALLLIAALLFLAASTALAVPTINIFDLPGVGNPLVTTSDFISIMGEINPEVTTAPEFANVSGTLWGTSIYPYSYGFRMLESAISGAGTVDSGILRIEQGVFNQLINLTFISDGATDFDISYYFPSLGSTFSVHYNTFAQALGDYESFRDQGYIYEDPGGVFPADGTLQNIFFGDIVVNAQSDFVAAPLPGTLLLLGSGFLGLVGFRRCKNRANPRSSWMS